MKAQPITANDPATTIQRIVDVPFNALLGLQASSDPDRVLTLVQRLCLNNHIGTLHAGALMALAEAASAEFLLRRFGLPAGVVPLLRRFEAKFSRPARGQITSAASAAAAALEQFGAEVAQKGWSLVNVDVELYDEVESKVLVAKATWFCSRSG